MKPVTVRPYNFKFMGSHWCVWRGELILDSWSPQKRIVMEEALDRERRERGAEIARLAKEKKEREEEQRRREKEEIDMKVQMDQLERLKKTAVGAKVFADVTAEVRPILLPTTPSQHRLFLLFQEQVLFFVCVVV